MSPREHRRIINKQRLLPEQYARAFKRLEHLEAELHRYGMPELIAEARRPTSEQYLTDLRQIDRAWDREVEIALIRSEQGK